MTTTLHSVATRTYLGMLKGLSSVLAKAETNAAERKIDPSVFLNARLAPDMFPLIRQVQIATDHVKGSMHRVAGTQPPKWEDTETSFAELQARIERASELVRSFGPETLNGREAESVTLKVGPGEMTFAMQDYLFGYAFGNFYFHTTTAYNILRQCGVPLGKGDYFGR
jgi:uncharacterized protein